MVKQGSEATLFPVPDSEILGIITKATGEDRKLELAETLLYQWLKNQPYFPNDYDRNIIRSFLRGSKFDVERTKRVLQQCYATRRLYPEIFADRYPADKYIQKAEQVLNIGTIPSYSPEGYRTFIFKFTEGDDECVIAAAKYFFAFYDLLMRCPHEVAGENCIMDVQDLSATFLVRSFPNLKNVVVLLRKAFSTKLKQTHILVKPSSGIDKLLGLLRPFLHPKVKENTFIHDDCTKLLNHFPKEALPSTYGGSYKSMKELSTSWQEYISENAEWLDEHHRDVKLDLPIKNQSLYCNDDLGINGCFRKLDID